MRMNKLKTKIKDGFNRILEDANEKNEFVRYIELVVLLPAATYVAVRNVVDWIPCFSNFWFLYLPSIASLLFRYLQNRNLKFIVKVALLIIGSQFLIVGALYIASQLGHARSAVWLERLIDYFWI